MAKQAKTDRQAVIESIRSQQKSEERRRGLMIVGVCAAVALLIVLAAAYRPIKNWWDLRQFSNVAIDKIGAPASVCGKETTKKATGSSGTCEVSFYASGNTTAGTGPPAASCTIEAAT